MHSAFRNLRNKSPSDSISFPQKRFLVILFNIFWKNETTHLVGSHRLCGRFSELTTTGRKVDFPLPSYEHVMHFVNHRLEAQNLGSMCEQRYPKISVR